MNKLVSISDKTDEDLEREVRPEDLVIKKEGVAEGETEDGIAMLDTEPNGDEKDPPSKIEALRKVIGVVLNPKTNNAERLILNGVSYYPSTNNIGELEEFDVIPGDNNEEEDPEDQRMPRLVKDPKFKTKNWR